MAPLDQLIEGVGHVVTQVVEAELVVGAVGDVGGVGRAPLIGVQPRQDHPDLEPQEAVHPTHPLAVTFGQIIVDGDDMHTFTAEGVEVGRQHAGQGFPLTGLHLRDVAEVQGRTTHHLHVEMPLGQHPPGSLAGDGERLGQQVVELLAIGDALAELIGLGPQFGVGQLLDVVGEGVDVVGDPPEAFDHPTFTDAQQLRQHMFPWNDCGEASPGTIERGLPLRDWRLERPPS